MRQTDITSPKPHSSGNITSTEPPLCIDLDGTLNRTDTLHEQIVWLAFHRPLAFFGSLIQLVRGLACFKQTVVGHCAGYSYPWLINENVIQFAKREKDNGRMLVLATASDEKTAQDCAKQYGLFDGILASRDGINLKGRAKAEKLVECFGECRFDYIGDSETDLPVWAKARKAYVVSAAGSRLPEKAKQVNNDVSILPLPSKRPFALLRVMRPHQWLKNLLVFLPLVAAHSRDVSQWTAAALAWICFSLTASAVYLLNDLADIPNDRRHARKCARPIASGQVSVPTALRASLLLFAGGLALAWSTLPARFGICLLLYMVVTSAYTARLRRLVLWDVATLAFLYAFRIFSGGAATHVTISAWLLAFAMFFFFSLAIMKRVAELVAQRNVAKDASGTREYKEVDFLWLSHFGTGCSLTSILVLALYLNSSATVGIYKYPHWLWVPCALGLLWSMRAWIKTFRGEMHDDPVFFAAKDAASWVIAILSLVAVYCSTGINL